MVEYYFTENKETLEVEGFTHDCWINMIDPTYEEAENIASKLGVDEDDLLAAIDLEEKTRIELPDSYTLIVIDIPVTEVRNSMQVYTTIPLGIIMTQEAIVTICAEDTPVLKTFTRNRIYDFSTRKKLRFVYQIMLATAQLYQKGLYAIDKQRQEIEAKVHVDVEEDDLFRLHELESWLVYFATSLRENGNVLDRLTRYHRLKRFPEDQDLLDDVIVENQQAIEMTDINRSILDGTRQLMSTVFDNRLNNVMKILTSVTLILAIPTVISGLYGMNVRNDSIPLASNPYAFGIISVLIVIICLLLVWILKRKRML